MGCGFRIESGMTKKGVRNDEKGSPEWRDRLANHERLPTQDEPERWLDFQWTTRHLFNIYHIDTCFESFLPLPSSFLRQPAFPNNLDGLKVLHFF